MQLLEARMLLAGTPAGTMPSGYVPVNFKVGPIVADRTRDRVYVTDLSNDRLRVFDTSSARQIDTIPVIGDDVEAIDAAPDGSSIAIAYYTAKKVQVIDAAALSTTRTIALDFTPFDLAIGTGGKVYVSHSSAEGTSGVVAYDLASGSRGHSIPNLSDEFLQTDASGSRLYVSGEYDGQVREYDIRKPSQLSAQPLRFFYTDASNLKGFVADRTASRVFVADGPVYGLRNVDMAKNEYQDIKFDDPIFNEGMASVEGKPDVFVRSDERAIYQIAKSTGAKRYRYVTRDIAVQNAIAATPNGRVMYVSKTGDGTFGLGIIGAKTLDITGSPLTVSGSVFSDTDLDGRHDSNETDFLSLTVYLDLDHDGKRDQTRYDDAVDEPFQYIDATYGEDGGFQLQVPGPGKYTIAFEAPEFGNYQDVIATHTSAMTFTIAAGQQVTGLDLGASYASLLEVNFFLDSNGDGSRQSSEVSGGAADLYLDLNGNAKADPGEPVQRYTTDEDLSAGNPDYYISSPYFISRPGTYDLRTLASSRTQPSRAVTRVTLQPNEQTTAAIGIGTPRHLVGRLFHDLDADGVRDADETGYGGVAVWLDLDGDGRRDTNEPAARTKLNGAYDITAAFAVDNAVIRYANEFGRLTSTAHRRRVTLGGDVTSVRSDAGVYLPPTIVLDVFIDTDHDGVRDAGEASRAGVPVYLDLDLDDKQDRNEPTAVTNADGLAIFSNLSEHSYFLRTRLSATQKLTTARGHLLDTKRDTAATFTVGLI